MIFKTFVSDLDSTFCPGNFRRNNSVNKDGLTTPFRLLGTSVVEARCRVVLFSLVSGESGWETK